MTHPHPAAAALAGIGIFNRLRKRQRRKRCENSLQQQKEAENRPSHERTASDNPDPSAKASDGFLQSEAPVETAPESQEQTSPPSEQEGPNGDTPQSFPQPAIPAPHSRTSVVNSLFDVVNSLFKAVIYSVLLVIYLVVEVFLAMLAYMYLNLYHFETFGYLIGLSREFLNAFATQLERYSPELANQAYATVLGELGAKSVLLLFIGLAVSTLIRILIWFVHKGMETVRTEKAQEA